MASAKTGCLCPLAQLGCRGRAWCAPQPGEGAAPPPEEPAVVAFFIFLITNGKTLNKGEASASGSGLNNRSPLSPTPSSSPDVSTVFGAEGTALSSLTPTGSYSVDSPGALDRGLLLALRLASFKQPQGVHIIIWYTIILHNF